MKKYILAIMFVLSICLVGCGSAEDNHHKRVQTEVIGNKQITYIYNLHDDTIVSKNVFDKDTGVTTEYVYYYTDEGRGDKLIGVNVITIAKDGQVTGEFKDNITEIKGD